MIKKVILMGCFVIKKVILMIKKVILITYKTALNQLIDNKLQTQKNKLISILIRYAL